MEEFEVAEERARGGGCFLLMRSCVVPTEGRTDVGARLICITVLCSLLDVLLYSLLASACL